MDSSGGGDNDVIKECIAKRRSAERTTVRIPRQNHPLIKIKNSNSKINYECWRRDPERVAESSEQWKRVRNCDRESAKELNGISISSDFSYSGPDFVQQSNPFNETRHTLNDVLHSDPTPTLFKSLSPVKNVSQFLLHVLQAFFFCFECSLNNFLRYCKKRNSNNGEVER